MKTRSIFILCFIAFIFIFNTSYAKRVSLKHAGQVATNFYIEHSLNRISAKSVSITENFEITESDHILIYIFNFSTSGFVMVSGDDKVTPVLGYSYESNYYEQDQSPEFIFWVNSYKEQILEAITSEYITPVEVSEEWTRLIAATDVFVPTKDIKAVDPLLLSTWDQGSCYNSLSPINVDGPGGRCWAGCVATTMAQVMYYYRFPDSGQGSHSYYLSPYGTLSANFATATYDYNAMANVCNGSTTEIGELIYHAGVSVDMHFTPYGSGANMGDATNAMVSHFKYSSSIQHKSKNQYSSSAWTNLLRTELDNKRPIMYAGWDSNEGGHAWVCDGYQGTSYFHFNWGWSGSANGYYYLNALTPAGYNFSNGQEAIYNIYPSGNYPNYCTGTKNINTSTGTFEDGSGPSNYSNNADCSWLVAPTGADHLSFSFNALNTEANNDVVTFYDGPTTAATVLGTFSGSTVPTTNITSTSPTVLVKFTTNGSVTNTGWQISYHTYYPTYCSGTTVLTALTDTFSDGSGINNYNNNTTCQWLIQPTNAGSITLHFMDFNVEAINDKVRVIDIVNSTVLGEFSGTSIPSAVTAPSGQVKVIFQTNGNTNAQGWTAYYTSFQVGIEDFTTLKQLSVYPNPAKDQLHISFNITDGNAATIEMMDITGQIVYSESHAGNSACATDIDLSSFSKGIYFLRIRTSGDIISKKIVVD